MVKEIDDMYSRSDAVSAYYRHKWYINVVRRTDTHDENCIRIRTYCTRCNGTL